MEQKGLLLFNARRILRKDTLHGPLPSDRELLGRILRVAWPAVVEALFLSLVNFVDTLMVSTLGDVAVASVGLVGQPRMLCFALFMGLQPAVSALIARRRGEGDRDSANRVLRMSLVLTLGLAAVISVVAFTFANGIIRFAGSQPETHDDAVVYFRIIVAGLVFNVVNMTINGAQRGNGNTKIAMRTSLVSNSVNVVLNYCLIGGKLGFPRMGVAGAALATVLGTVAGMVMAILSVMSKNSYISLRYKVNGIFEKRSLTSIIDIGTSAFIEQLVLRVGFFLFARIIASLGTLAVTTHQICSQVMTLSFAFGNGLSSTAIALVGRSLGERRPDIAKVMGSFCQRLGLICSAVMSIFYIFFGGSIVTLFSETPEVIETGRVLMRLLTVIVLFQLSQVIFTGCLRGNGDAKFTTLVSLINIGFLRPGIAYLMVNVFQFGLAGAWLGMGVDQAIRLTMTATRFYRGKWMEKQI